MRAFRICGCWLLLLMLGSSGCNNTAYVRKGPEVKTNTVKISNCKADPDTAQVPNGQTLTWVIDPADTHTYSITFPGNSPFSSSQIPPGQAQKVTSTFWCSALGGISTSLCVYGYDLVQQPSTSCPDPGVHVVPGSG